MKQKNSRARRPHQFSFFKPSPGFFGGALLKGRRKSQRPLAFKRPIHIVMRSEKACGRWSFINTSTRRKVERWLAKFAGKNALRVYEKAIVSNHLHLLVKFPNREAYNSFIRALAGTLPRSIFRFQSKTESFWDHRPFTRIVEWGRDYLGTKNYVERNELEALGAIPYRRRKDRYARWLKDRGAVKDRTAKKDRPESTPRAGAQSRS